MEVVLVAVTEGFFAGQRQQGELVEKRENGQQVLLVSKKEMQSN